jgi:hypothetical protein
MAVGPIVEEGTKRVTSRCDEDHRFGFRLGGWGWSQAEIVVAILRKMMNWHLTRNEDYVSPIVKGMSRYATAAHKRERILDENEIRAVFKAADEAGTFGAIVQGVALDRPAPREGGAE